MNAPQKILVDTETELQNAGGTAGPARQLYC